jgi:hypothetical protein
MAVTGNATYTTANGAAYAIELVVKRDFKVLWDKAHPLTNKLQRGANFNREGMIKGLSAILPIQFDDLAVPVDGSAVNNLTALTPQANKGDTQANYAFTRYHGAFWLDPDELQLLVSGQRGDMLGARKKQIMQSYAKALSGDLQNTAAAARANVEGLRHLLSGSNTVGGIAQGGENTYWDAKVNTTGGTFAIAHVDDDMDAIDAEGRSKVDLILLSNNSTINMTAKMRENVAALQRIVSSADRANFGFSSFVYRDADCVQDPDLGAALSTTGGYQALSTDTFYWWGDPKKMKITEGRLLGTGAQEFYHEAWVCLANDDPACNAYRTAYTS